MTQDEFNEMLQVAIAQGIGGGVYTSVYSGEEIDTLLGMTSYAAGDQVIADITTTVTEAAETAQQAAENVQNFVAPTFNAEAAYSVGDLVIYNGQLYRFTSAHTAGAWNPAQVVETTVEDELDALNAAISSATITEPQSYSDTQKETARQNIEAAGYDAYPAKSLASAPIQSFSDGADGIPVKSAAVTLTLNQPGSGDPSPSNVRPVETYPSLVVTRTGKNILDVDTWGRASDIGDVSGITITRISPSLYHAAGTATATRYFRVSFTTGVSDAMPCAQFVGKPLYFSTGNPDVSLGMQYFRADGTTASLTNGAALPSDAAGLRLQVTIANGTTIDADFYVQLEIGTEATAFEAYDGETYTASLSLGSGAVVAGTVDVAAGTMTVTHVSVSGGSVRWVGQSTSNTFTTNGLTSNGFPYNRANGPSNMWSNVLANAGTTAIADLADYSMRSANGNANITVRLDSAASVWSSGGVIAAGSADAETYFGSVQIAYTLATPVTLEIDPVGIATLLGANVIWPQAGTLALTYRRDPTLALEQLEALSLTSPLSMSRPDALEPAVSSTAEEEEGADEG